MMHRSLGAPEPGERNSAEAVAEEQIRLGMLDEAEKGHAQPEAASWPAPASSSSVKVPPAAAGPLAKPAAPAAPLDVVYIQSLIEDQLGPPKFAVPKESQAPPKAPPAAPGLSLEELLDKEFGPPKFAVPKNLGATVADQGVSGQQEQPSGTKRGAAGEDVAGGAAGEVDEVPLLTLRVTAGPAAGAQFMVDDDHLEYKIGRNPDCDIQILDAEISSRHATIKWSAEQLCWVFVDIGSLNGTILNGRVVSAEYKVPGQPQRLAHGDSLELGSATRVTVALGGKRHQPTDALLPASTSNDYGGSLALQGQLPPPLTLEQFGCLHGLHLAVQQKVGADHARQNMGCEDVPHWEAPFAPYSHAGIFCIFDGHTGAKAAMAAKERLPAVLRAKLEAAAPAGGNASAASNGESSSAPLPPQLVSGRPLDVQRALLRDVFLETDSAMSMDEGCTATLLLVEAGLESAGGGLLLQSANVGDSSAVVINVTRSSVTKLTADHRIASSTSERARLAARGHTVRTRLYGLNISRMLGDRFLKDEDLGFLADPHVSDVVTVAAGEEAYVVIASDGLWDVVPEEKAGKMLLLEAAKPVASPGMALSAAAVADMLLGQALMLRSKDDITVAVLHVLGSGNSGGR